MRDFKHVTVLYIVIILLVSTIVVMQCGSSDNVTTVNVPSVTGSITSEDPKELIKDSIYQYTLRDTIIKYTSFVDTVRVTNFVNSTETVKVAKYIEASRVRTYTDTIEDSDIRFRYLAETEGSLRNMKIDYTIKPRTIEVPKPKEVVFSMYGGVGLNTTTDLNKVVPVGTLGVKVKSGDIIYGSYGLDNTVTVGYMFKVFDIKK